MLMVVLVNKTPEDGIDNVLVFIFVINFRNETMLVKQKVIRIFEKM